VGTDNSFWCVRIADPTGAIFVYAGYAPGMKYCLKFWLIHYTLKVRDYGKLVQEKINSLHELYSTARELSTEQLALWLEVAIVLLILWEVIKPIIQLL
jgi:hypothetical protein